MAKILIMAEHDLTPEEYLERCNTAELVKLQSLLNSPKVKNRLEIEMIEAYEKRRETYVEAFKNSEGAKEN